MKKTIIITILVFCNNIFAQQGKIFTELNYNTFSHSSLSDFQIQLVSELSSEINLITTDDFPGNIGFSLGYEITDINTAIFLSYNSTGAKSSYSDYSGAISLEQQLNAISFGGIYLLNLDKKDRFKLGLKGFAMFSSLDISSRSELTDQFSSSDSISFNAIDIGIGATLIYEYTISFLILRASLGFDLVLGGKLNFDDIDEAYLLDNSDNEVNTAWSGLRTGIGIAIPIN